jgi:hypothetical protein
MAFASVTVGMVANSAPASAAAYCGSGYTVVDSDKIERFGQHWGTVYLTYNSSNGYNCVTTVKNSFVGTKTWTGAVLQVQDAADPAPDYDYYEYYAGPVYAKASGKCVKWFGLMQNPDEYAAKGGNDATWSHCG